MSPGMGSMLIGRDASVTNSDVEREAGRGTAGAVADEADVVVAGARGDVGVIAHVLDGDGRAALCGSAVPELADGLGAREGPGEGPAVDRRGARVLDAERDLEAGVPGVGDREADVAGAAGGGGARGGRGRGGGRAG